MGNVEGGGSRGNGRADRWMDDGMRGGAGNGALLGLASAGTSVVLWRGIFCGSNSVVQQDPNLTSELEPDSPRALSGADDKDECWWYAGQNRLLDYLDCDRLAQPRSAPPVYAHTRLYQRPELRDSPQRAAFSADNSSSSLNCLVPVIRSISEGITRLSLP